jgi:hypothetical protein
MGRQSTYLYPWFGALALAVITAGIGYGISHTSKGSAMNPTKASTSSLTAAAVFSVAPSKKELEHVLATLVQESAQPKKNSETEKTVQALVTKLSDQDYQVLQEKVLGANNEMPEREAALYVLTLSSAPQAQGTLVTLAATALPEFKDLSDPHSVGSTQRTLELSLRVTALENLDQRAVGSPQVAKDLESILQKQTEPSLRFLAQTSLSGIESGKPGKLKRVIDEMLGTAK